MNQEVEFTLNDYMSNIPHMMALPPLAPLVFWTQARRFISHSIHSGKLANYYIDTDAAKMELDTSTGKIKTYEVDWKNYSNGTYAPLIKAKYYGRTFLPNYLYRAEIIAHILRKKADKVDVDSYTNAVSDIIEKVLSDKISETEANKRMTNLYLKLKREADINSKKDAMKLVSQIFDEIYKPLKYLLYAVAGIIVGTVVIVKLTGVSIPIPGTPLSIGGSKGKLINRKKLPIRS